MNKKNFVLWLTGLSGAGKTTLAKKINERFKDLKIKAHHLDGDEVREASGKNLGFSMEDRDKNIELAINMTADYCDRGYVVVASFISPYERHRQWGRERLDNFVEVFVDASLDVCENRDVKGMYKKARRGEIELFTGISDVYELPKGPHIHLKTDEFSVDECLVEVERYLVDNHYI